ncbi:porin family protein [Pendulispora rubella]|uniref:Porin family protein n=1 Tax=Pendulispora rubella TaxID=2741070 RepID=A0ABZ2LMK3_9BACT
MRKALVAAVLSAATLFSVPALAADTEKKIGVGGDAMFVIPVGDFSDITGIQFGLLGRGGYRVLPQLEITGRIGYIHGFKKEFPNTGGNVKSGVSVIPVWAGARWFFFSDNPLAGPYAGGELGLNFISTHPDPGDGDSYTRFGFNAFGGYVISPELPIDIRGQFLYYNLIGKDSRDLPGGSSITENTALGFGISVGYTYQL